MYLFRTLCFFLLLALTSSSLLFYETRAAAQEELRSLESDYRSLLSRLATQQDPDVCRSVEAFASEYPDFFGSYDLKGLCAAQRKELGAAKEYFRRSLELAPRQVLARSNLASVLLQENQIEEAIPHLEALLDLRPDDLPTLVNLGKIKLARGSFREAEELFSRAYDLAPNRPQVFLSLAASRVELGKLDSALPILTAVMDRLESPPALISAAILAYRAGSPQLADRGLARARSLDPRTHELVWESAVRSFARGDFPLVSFLLRDETRCLETDAECSMVYGYSLYKEGRPESALKFLYRALELQPEREDFYLKLGELLFAYNSHEAARPVFQAGLARLPQSVLIRQALAITYLAGSPDLPQAEEHLEKILEIQPDFEPALELLCRTAEKARAWGELAERAARLQETNPNSPEGFYYAAQALLQEGQTPLEDPKIPKAARLLEESLELDSDFAEAHLALGRLLARQERWDEAIAHLETAARLDSRSEQVFYHLAQVYRGGGEREKSLSAFARYEELSEERRNKKWEALFQVKGP